MVQRKVFVLLGATGSLSREKILPILPKIAGINTVAYGRSNLDYFHDENLLYVRGDLNSGANLVSEIKKFDSNKLYFYLALPPGLYPLAIDFIRKNFKGSEYKVALEKPFGGSLAESKKLASTVNSIGENFFYIVDHYLAKPFIGSLKIGQSIAHLSAIEISILESKDVSDRGIFYDQIGVIKDCGQSHLLNVVNRFFVENGRDDFLRKAVYVKNSLILGQYEKYTNVPGVSHNSLTPTFFKADFKYNNILVTIRSGKALDTAQTSINLLFHNAGPTSSGIKTKEKIYPPAHKLIIEDFLNDSKNYSLKIDDAILSWVLTDNILREGKNRAVFGYKVRSSYKLIESKTLKKVNNRLVAD